MAFLLALFFALTHGGLLAQAATFPATTALKTESGPVVQAFWGVPSKAQRGVVLVHGDGRTKEDWLPLADKLYRSGLAIIAVDLRGHGALATSTPLTAADYPHMVEEVRAAAVFLHTKGVTSVALIGADLGANLAINHAADDISVASVILLSPLMDAHGVIANDAVVRFGARPLLLVASSDDAYVARTAKALDALARGEHKLLMYDRAGKGAQMLNHEPTLVAEITGFLTKSWSGAPKPPPATTAPPEVGVTNAPIQTDGPTTPDMPTP